MRVTVVYGGNSPERAVSLRSAANVKQQLDALGHEVRMLDPSVPDFDAATITKNCDIVFPLIHGAGGEDGVLQRKLEGSAVAFVGSGSAACALTFDKHIYRNFLQKNRIRVAAGEVVNKDTFQASALRQAPYVLKPVDGGSSLDTAIVRDLADEPDAAVFRELFTKYPTMLLERYMAGQEITVGVLGDMALPVILIVPPEGKQFDYENKYNGATAEITNPSQIDPSLQQRAQQLALQIHGTTGCRHMSRTDMIIAPDGSITVLETNTIPGMTEQSLFPKMAAAQGISMQDLTAQLLDMAIRTPMA